MVLFRRILSVSTAGVRCQYRADVPIGKRENSEFFTVSGENLAYADMVARNHLGTFGVSVSQIVEDGPNRLEVALVALADLLEKSTNLLVAVERWRGGDYGTGLPEPSTCPGDPDYAALYHAAMSLAGAGNDLETLLNRVEPLGYEFAVCSACGGLYDETHERQGSCDGFPVSRVAYVVKGSPDRLTTSGESAQLEV